MIDIEEIKKLAKLAKISMNQEELEQLTIDMTKIISFADTINQSYDSEPEFKDINNISNVFREDKIEDSFDRSLILSGVNGGDDGFFVVKKLI